MTNEPILIVVLMPGSFVTGFIQNERKLSSLTFLLFFFLRGEYNTYVLYCESNKVIIDNSTLTL